MAFIGEKITNESDKAYVASKGFTYITGEPIDSARSWAIDRERDMILVSRGGGGLEMPESYGLYLWGKIVDIEGYKETEGNRFDNNLKIHWHIKWFNKPFESREEKEMLAEIIKEAFTAFAYRGLKSSQVLEVTIDIEA